MNHFLAEHRERMRSYLNEKDQPSESEISLFARTGKYSRLCAWIPGLRMIAIGNTLAMYCSDEESDIDLFVVTDPHRMWLVRLVMTFLFQILGVRRYGKHVAGRMCLSFYATTNAIDLEKISIENDVYLAHWCETIKPIVDIGNAYDLFLGKNRWISVSEKQKKENSRFIAIRKPQKKERFPWVWNALDTFFEKVFKPKTLAHNARIGNPW